MAIEKNNFKASRFDSDCSPGSRDSMSGEEEEFQIRASGPESEEDDEFDDVDSGAGSDDFDLLELGETGAEFCQVGSSTCSVPFELYDLPNLEDVLSVDVWNECLTEEERLGLAKFLPDMDQETYMQTLMDLFKGRNFHFGSPLKKLFDMLKGGLCEPRVALYREGWNSFCKRKHYHFIKKHQNGLVSSICQIRDNWLNCRGYSIEEKLRVLNIVKSQKSLMGEKEDMQSESSGRDEFGERLWSRRSKDRKPGRLTGPSSVYGVDPDLEASPVLEPAKYRKQNSKGALKTPSARQLTKVAATDTGAEPARSRHRMPGFDEVEDSIFPAGSRMDKISSHRFPMDKQGHLAGKNSDLLGTEGMAMDGFVGLPLSSKGDRVYDRKKHGNELFDMKMMKAKQHSISRPYDYMNKAKYPEIGRAFDGEFQMRSMKGLKGNRGGAYDLDESFWHDPVEREASFMDPEFQYDDWNPRNKKLKVQKESDLNAKSYRASLPQMSNGFLTSDVKGRHSHEKTRGSSLKNVPVNTFLNGDVTESDSSDSYSDDESNPLMRSKTAYPTGFMEGARSSPGKSSADAKKGKVVKKKKKESVAGSDGNLQSHKKKDDLGEPAYPPEQEEIVYPLKGKKNIKKGKAHNDPSVQTTAGVEEENFLHCSGTDDRRKARKSYINDQLEVGPTEGPSVSPLRAEPTEDKQMVEVSGHDYAVVLKEDGPIEELLLADEKKSNKRRKKGKNVETSDATVAGRKPAKRKRKVKSGDVADNDNGTKLHAEPQQHIGESGLLEEKTGKKMGADGVASENETPEVPINDMGVTDTELENGPSKKVFTLITPTVHTDFSFSIIHLLSAVRCAMILPPEYSLDLGLPMEDAGKIQEGGINEESSSQKNVDVAGSSEQDSENNAPSLTIQEIVDRVRSNPLDPEILVRQEPLQDLVKGALKIFSSKSAPLGAKGWKALAVYERSKKGWRWMGPIPYNSSDCETIEVSPDAWGLPHKMLVKLVDSFANWLKSGQETLQQIGSLPPPPLSLLQCIVDEKERFRDLRAQKSLSTINPSSEEVREYFRKEEFLRYSIPDRAFAYTAADGKKSLVAPLKRCGGKPTSKARDHFLLKRDRPPHVTILCLVRDAASRLPGSIGTRADVCTLIRDSQYVVEEVPDAQINQVVSGALDRLHYERDPCVMFDGERKLWKYLHREREEEDFEDDGTSSTKKWRRPKKDTAEPSEQGAVTVAYHENGEQIGIDICSDLNMEPVPIDDDKVADPAMIDDLGQNIGHICNSGAEHIGIPQDQQMVWEAFDLNPLRDNKLLCQENSTNEDFDDETFGRERTVGLVLACYKGYSSGHKVINRMDKEGDSPF